MAAVSELEAPVLAVQCHPKSFCSFTSTIKADGDYARAVAREFAGCQLGSIWIVAPRAGKQGKENERWKSSYRRGADETEKSVKRNRNTNTEATKNGARSQ